MNLQRITYICIMVMAILVLFIAPVISAQQPQPPQLPNPNNVMSTRYVDVTSRTSGILNANWQALVQKYLNRGYFIEYGPFQSGPFWYVIVSKWIQVAAPAIMMMPDPCRYPQSGIPCYQ